MIKRWKIHPCGERWTDTHEKISFFVKRELAWPNVYPTCLSIFVFLKAVEGWQYVWRTGRRESLFVDKHLQQDVMLRSLRRFRSIALNRPPGQSSLFFCTQYNLIGHPRADGVSPNLMWLNISSSSQALKVQVSSWKIWQHETLQNIAWHCGSFSISWLLLSHTFNMRH